MRRVSGTHNASTLWPVSCQVPKSSLTHGEPTPFSGGVLLDGHLERQTVLDLDGADDAVAHRLHLGE